LNNEHTIINPRTFTTSSFHFYSYICAFINHNFQSLDHHKVTHIIRHFFSKAEVKSFKSLGNGHINDTYLVLLDTIEEAYVLQRKNHEVFKDIDGMMRNIQKVTQQIKEKLISEGAVDVRRKVMTYLPTSEGSNFFLDEDNNYWTICLFIENSRTIENVTQLTQALNAGKAFGKFQYYLKDLPGTELIETIPNFHNGIFRDQQLKTAIALNPQNRVEEVIDEINFLISMSEEMCGIQHAINNGELPLRITHNDTKINNVLFDINEEILCIIDLDTVMPGTILFDFGDAIRTLCNTGAEDEKDLANIDFHLPYFKAFTEGYLEEIKDFITPNEVAHLSLSCLYMAWEQALRFLADYINGDTYYKIKYPSHNKVRAQAQIKYLKTLIANRDILQNFINEQIKR
jgi:thiamine kinase-like enzyme